MMDVQCQQFLQEIQEILFENSEQQNEYLVLEQAILWNNSYPQKPIIGILGEPLRFQLQFQSASLSNDQYIPLSHVQYLQQAGYRVVPIDYKLTYSELRLKLDKVNGLYMHGDGLDNLITDEFQDAVTNVIEYATQRNKADKIHFPLYMMGNSIQSLVKHLTNAISTIPVALQNMKIMYGKSYSLRWIKDKDTTQFMHGYSYYASQDIMEQGQFLNRNYYGLQYKLFSVLRSLNQEYEIVATFKRSGVNLNQQDKEFVAIMKHQILPIFVFTYSVEMTQFVFMDRTRVSSNQIDEIDHSLMARTHAQFLVNLMWAESRLCKAAYAVGDTVSGSDITIGDVPAATMIQADLIELLTINNIYFYQHNKENSLPPGYLYNEVYYVTSQA